MHIKYKISYEDGLFRCNESSINEILKETYKRLVLPFYILVSAFISACLVIKSKNQNNFFKFRSIIFLIGFTIIIYSEGSSNFLSFFDLTRSTLVLIPFILMIIFYLILNSSNKFKPL